MVPWLSVVYSLIVSNFCFASTSYEHSSSFLKSFRICPEEVDRNVRETSERNVLRRERSELIEPQICHLINIVKIRNLNYVIPKSYISYQSEWNNRLHLCWISNIVNPLRRTKKIGFRRCTERVVKTQWDVNFDAEFFFESIASAKALTGPRINGSPAILRIYWRKRGSVDAIFLR